MEAQQEIDFLYTGLSLFKYKAIFAIDKDGVILLWNSGIAQLTGFSSGEKLNLSELYDISNNQVNFFEYLLSDAEKSGESEQEAKWLRKNGEVFWVNIKLKSVFKNLVFIGFSVFVKDLTEEKKQKEELRISEAKNHLLAANAMGIVWTRNSEGAFVEPQLTWEMYTGQAYEEYQDFGWLNAHPAMEREELIASWQKAKEEGVYKKLSRIWSKDKKEYRYVMVQAKAIYQENGRLEGWMGTDTDVHDLQVAKEELKVAYEKISLTLNAVQIGTWLWTPSDGTIICDEHTLELLGFRREKVVIEYEEFLSVVHPDDRIEFEKKLNVALDKESTFETEYRIIWSDKSIHFMIGRGLINRNAEGKVEQVKGFCWDVTERKQLEKDRLEALRREKEMAEIYHERLMEYINTLCHELRNPLNGIYGAVNFLLSAFLDLQKILSEKISDQQFEDISKNFYMWIDSLKESADNQKAIVDDVLNLSKLLSGKITLNPTIFDPKEAINKVVKMFLSQLKQKNLGIYYLFPEEDFLIETDADRLNQILVNLVSNAVKFTQHGEINISLKYKAISESNDVEIEISVKDSGIGMSLEEQSHLFEGFTQAHSKIAQQYGGSGLGLTIIKKMVELMGGGIDVQSEKGKGTIFIFTIKAKKFSYQKQMAVQARSKISATSKQVLIVEDNIVNQRILNRYLTTDFGYQVDIVDNGLKAVEAVKNQNAKKYNIIFMDIEMPVMGGLEATRLIREYEKNVSLVPAHIIGVSGNASQGQIQKALNAGMNDYLTKPYHKDALHDAIAKSDAQEIEEPVQKMQKISPYNNVSFLTQIGGLTSLPETSALVSYTFYLDAIYKDAKSILVVGDFNNWLNAKEGQIDVNNNKIDEWRMKQSEVGTWSLTHLLPPGHYEYKFIIDNEYWAPPGNLKNLTLDLVGPQNENTVSQVEQMPIF